MTPETAMYVRDLMKYGGALLVALGYMNAPAGAALAGLSDLVVPLLIALSGVLTAALATIWAWKAKQAVSPEAQTIAGRVEVHPTAQPILPPGPLDEQAKDAHL